MCVSFPCPFLVVGLLVFADFGGRLCVFVCVAVTDGICFFVSVVVLVVVFVVTLEVYCVSWALCCVVWSSVPVCVRDVCIFTLRYGCLTLFIRCCCHSWLVYGYVGA